MKNFFKISVFLAILPSVLFSQNFKKLENFSKFDELFLQEAVRFELSFDLLKAVAITESKLNENAINTANKNGTSDFGLMQINEIHLKRFKNLTKDDLLIPNINVYLGAEILKRCVLKHGLNWRALNCYNGKIVGNSYSNRVIENLIKLQKENL